MPQKIYDVIIIGSGPAGMTAGIYCARKGLNSLIIGKEIGGQVSKSAEIENYTGIGKTTGTDLTKSFHEHIKQFANITHLHDVSVVDVKKNKSLFIIKTDNKKYYQAKSVIIASGRNPRQLGISGEKEYKNKGVSYCEVCDGPLFKNKKTAVIGGGNSGLEAALSLANLCPKVYILEFLPQLKADKILQDKIKQQKNIEVITNVQVTEVLGDKFVTSLKYKNRQTNKEKLIKIAGVFIEIGWIPSIDFDKISKKNKQNEIITDKQGRTSIDGLFAAGDITDVGYWQIIIAAGEGAKAALSAYNYLSKLK